MKQIILPLLTSIAIVFSLSTSLFGATGNPEGFRTLEIGDQAPDFTLPGIDGKDHSLSDFKDPDILMVFFTSNHCPTSHAVEERLQNLLDRMESEKRSFGFVAINPNNPEGMTPGELGFGRYTDSFEDMVSYSRDNGWTFPYLYDGDEQTIARAYGCLATPHVFIFDRQRTLRYKGRFDDSRVPDPTTVKSHDAINALESLFAGKAVSVPVTKPHGCSTKWKEKRERVQAVQKQWESLPVDLDTINAAEVAALRGNGTNKFRMINLWATWCAPCVQEFPDLVHLQRTFGMRPFELITISLDEQAKQSRVKAFLEKNHASTPSRLKKMAAAEGRASNHLIYTGTSDDELSAALDPDWPGPLPHTVIINPDGEIVYRHNGVIDPVEVRSVLVDLLSPYWPNP